MSSAPLKCVKCGVEPYRNCCKICGQKHRTRADWNWHQVDKLILRKLINHQNAHGAGSFPDTLQIPTVYYRHIPEKFKSGIYSMDIVEKVAA